MRYVVLSVTVLAALCALPSSALAYNPCADVSLDSVVNIADIITYLEWFEGHTPLPEGRGDVDYRQGINFGDCRYISNYVFTGGPEGSCPPFAEYDILPTSDTIILPSGEIPAGAGMIGFPIYVVNKEVLHDLILPIVVNGLDSTTTSIEFETSNMQQVTLDESFGALKMLLGSSGLFPSYSLEPGIHMFGLLKITYDQASPATFSVDTTFLEDARFLHHVYGEQGLEEIGVPAVITSDVSPYPVMSVQPDSLFFFTMIDIPITEPDTFAVLSSGDPFSWTLTHDDWLQVTPTEGVSGQEVTVLPVTSGLSAGFHYGTITVSSGDALGSPEQVIVELELKQTYPSFDANCDGTFDIDDIVLLVNYMFGGGDPPCDPCTAE